MVIDCYAQRLLNPFRGAMHTVRYEAAEAVTVDGANWDIYVTDDLLLEGLARAPHTQVGDIRYGSWSEARGLRRGPRSPTADFRRLEAMGTVLFEHLASLQRELPFAFKDDHELWLLDTAGRPLALLHSVLDADEMTGDIALEWRAGFAARERFASDARCAPGDMNKADYLNRYVNRCAGDAPAAQWFRRGADGHGAGLGGIRLPAVLAGRVLAPTAFPPLLLADVGHDDAHRQLLDDFHAWQAVWLLTLPGLDPQQRRTLEKQVRRQALVVESQYRLYPETVDADLIQAARVEAMLRRTVPARREIDDSLPAFYIELGPYFNE
jgi:hypothetical protein